MRCPGTPSGQSDCGNCTLMQLPTRLLDPSEGRFAFGGVDLAALPAHRFARHPARADHQMDFQDSTGSLNPRYTAHNTISGPCKLRRELGLATLFVPHDLNVVRLLTDRVAVMYLGKIVEMGPSANVFEQPAHTCTQALVSAIPGCGPRVRLDGEISSPIDPPPTVCRFASRCPAVPDRCLREAPALHGPAATVAACHLARWPATAPAS